MFVKTIKENKYKLAILILLLINIPLAVFLVKAGLRVWLKAAPTVNITGNYTIVVSFTSPQVAEGDLIATLNQDSLGRVTGIVSQPDGSNATSITGSVEGNIFTSDPTRVTVKIKPPDEEIEVTVTADLTFTGTMNEAENKATGSVTGQTVGEKSRPIAGTFVANRTSGPPPSPTSTPSPTPRPTATLVPTSPPQVTSTPTPTPLPQATLTPVPTTPISPTPSPTSQPTSTPTLTPTPTATPTPKPGATATPKPTSTIVPTSSSLDVLYRFAQTACRPKVAVELWAEGTNFRTTLIFKDNKVESVSLGDLKIGQGYNFVLKGPMHLGVKRTLTKLNSGTNYLDFGTLLPGDVAPAGKKDDFINSLDWSVLSAWWGTSEKTVDLNCDGKVDALDASLMLENYFKKGVS